MMLRVTTEARAESHEPWDIEWCPAREQDLHDPTPVAFGDWLTPERIEVYVVCRQCGARGITFLDLRRMGKIEPRDYGPGLTTTDRAECT